MNTLKTTTSLQLFFEGTLVIANPMEAETDKAFLIKSPNGKWVGQPLDPEKHL
jgi:hypothetical protein